MISKITRSAVASLGVDSNETEAITNAVRDNLDLKTASREQINGSNHC